MTSPRSAQPSTGSRVAVSAAKGGCLLGLIGFTGGFFGPMIFAPGANQGPMLGIFFTGPAGLVLGLLIGAVAGWCRRHEPVPPLTGMPSRPRRLWLWLKTGEDGTMWSFVLLITGIMLGAVLTFWLFGELMRTKKDLADVGIVVAVFHAVALAWGFLGGITQPRQAPLWSTGLLMPLLLMAVAGPLMLLVMMPMVALNLGGVALGRGLRHPPAP
ncbi:MAG: hypothetical protein HS117_04700 [Verrucomicrobiaceae bacterium]|nr:hypothetical protein [Verrucomicrobiaceae bacterium]